MRRYENNFDLIRLVLAMLVVLGHFQRLPGYVANPSGIYGFGDFGIDAFFIVSGYLVYESFDRQPIIGAFYLRRFFRIYPLYLFTVLVQGIAMAILAGGIVAHFADLLRYLLPNLVMATFLAHGLGDLLAGLHNPGINPSLWTLKIEVAFYVLLPLIWYCTRRWKGGFLLALFAASTLFYIMSMHYDAPLVARQLPGQLRYFAAGMALYLFRDQISIKAPVLLAIALFCLCDLRHYLWFSPLYPICLGLLVFIVAFRLPVRARPYDISYDIYLFHGPMIQFSLLLGIFRPTVPFLLLLLAVLFISGFITSHLIERPAIALGKRLSNAWVARSSMRQDA